MKKVTQLILSLITIILLCSCQSTGNEQSKKLNSDISALSFCRNSTSCATAIEQRRSIISRYPEATLPTSQQFRITQLKGELDQLKFEAMGFPKYCSSVADCNLKIEEGSKLLQNLPAPYENKYPALREFSLKEMQGNLDNLKKQLLSYTYEQNLSKKGGVRLGMTKKQVIEQTSWGKPNKVNTTTTKNGTREQWVYGGGNYLYFTNGVLTSIQN